MCKGKIFILTFICVNIFDYLRAGDTVSSFENYALDDIIYDIYEQLSEEGEVNYEEVQEIFIELRADPININEATYENLQQLLILNAHQIDAILTYVYEHPMESIYELRLIGCLPDYLIRDIAPFVMVRPKQKKDKVYAKEVFKYGKHEILLQSKISDCSSPVVDHLSSSIKYKFNYRDKVRFGGVVNYVSKKIKHGEYIQLSNLGILKNAVVGNYSASIGLGLVLGDAYKFRDRAHPLNVGQIDTWWARYKSSLSNNMHGVATTLSFNKSGMQINTSLLYSITHPNDSLKLHTVGGNITLLYKRFQVGITIVENLYTDSVRYYFSKALYNQNYFRGIYQNIVGLHFRYNFGKVDIFGEGAGCQNNIYGWATTLGVRYYPVEYLGLVLMHRYFSPHYYNIWAHTFSQTSLVNDEHGIYFGADFSYFSKWNLSLFTDFYKFAGYKYRVNYFPSYGFDIQLNNEWHPNKQWTIKHNFRCREKTKNYYFSTKLRLEWEKGGWDLKTIGDFMFNDSTHKISLGYSLIQDVQYAFQTPPLVLQFRFQYFNTPFWDNRIYNYENDILYSFSAPFAYGNGIRTYLNMRVRVCSFLSLYFRVRETLYMQQWVKKKDLAQRSITDIHLLLRFVL